MKKYFEKLGSPYIVIPANWFLRIASIYVIVMGIWGLVTHFREGGFRHISWAFVELVGVLTAACVAVIIWQELVIEISSRQEKNQKNDSLGKRK